MASVTYTAQSPIAGQIFTCPRCQREHAYPRVEQKPIRCECGWWYTNVCHHHLVEEFKPRIGGHTG